jgi:hypothetical protein
MARYKCRNLLLALIRAFLAVLVLASFGFTIAFSARADNGKGLLQNRLDHSVPLVKKFRNVYWYGLIGVRSCKSSFGT